MKNKRFTKPEWAWMLYDFTTNAYATIILTAIFPIFFNAVLGHNTLGLELKGYAQSFIMLVAALSSPVLGVIGDSKGMKKRLWASFAFTGAIITLCLSFVGTTSWVLLLVGYILSNIAYNCAMLFYDSFITDVTTQDRMHKVSTTAFGIGYFGGGTMMLLVTAALMITTNNTTAAQVSFGVTAAWWILFSLPMLFRVRQTHFNPKPLKEVTGALFTQLAGTVKSIAGNKGMLLFMLAYFFYIDGVGTVITMATSYGSTLGLDSTLMIIAILTTQLVAVPFSILFGRLAERHSAIRMISIAIGVYIVICIVGFYMGNSIESAVPGTAAYTAAVSRGQILFWVMAGMVGTVQGGIQALSRSQFGQMVRGERSNEYFGFFNIFNRFASILGPLLMALVTTMTGRSSFGILSIIILFVVGGALLLSSRSHIHLASAGATDGATDTEPTGEPQPA
ncbi:MAG: MFS transporter [Propionibacteriaceae bacterium]|nr:MFS transporter [Propionibacteriaceae bacterium]